MADDPEELLELGKKFAELRALLDSIPQGIGEDAIAMSEKVDVIKSDFKENVRKKINEFEQRITDLEKRQEAVIKELREIFDAQ